MNPLKSLTENRRGAYTSVLDLLAKKLPQDESAIGVEFPYVTAPEGHWLTMPASVSAGYDGKAWSHGNWFCGFWVGLLLAAYLHTREEKFLVWARERMRLVAARCEDPNTHDIGFIFQGSALPFYHITGEAHHAQTALRAAQRLRARLITTQAGAFISSWGPLTDLRGRRSSAIDTMANLPLLYWAADYADDGSFRLAGEAHAAMTRRGMVREDHSTYHAVEYDLVSGERSRGFTFQGYADESCWPRGQAWAIYGYAATSRSTGKQEYLDLAVELGEYYLRRVGDTLIPPWDFDDPQAPNTLQDSSAAAIAAAGFLEIARLHEDEAVAAEWGEAALRSLDALCARCVAWEDEHRGVLKHGVYSKPHNVGPDSAVMFGDYYFIEALLKVLRPGSFLPQ